MIMQHITKIDFKELNNKLWRKLKITIQKLLRQKQQPIIKRKVVVPRENVLLVVGHIKRGNKSDRIY